MYRFICSVICTAIYRHKLLMWLIQLVYITYIVDLGCAVQDVITSNMFVFNVR